MKWSANSNILFFSYFSNSSDISKFNDYFPKVGTKLEKAISFTPYSSILENQVQSKFLKPVSENEIGNIIQKLKNERSSGSDGISNKMLKLASSVNVTSLTILMNRSMERATFPHVLKIAKGIPIYKEGDSESFENYSPL